VRIIGIDPGTYRTGFGIIDEDKGNVSVVACGCLEDRGKLVSKRYFSIYEQLSEVVKLYKPDCCSIESTFYYKNPKVTMRLGEIRGVLILTAVQAGMDIFEYAPLVVKQSVVGYGRADKSQVQKMVKALLGLSKLPKFNDVSDALALALCHVHNRKSVRRSVVKSV